MDTDVAAPTPEAVLPHRHLGPQRALQITLGLFWLLDAGLQFQPFMFGNRFTTTILLPNAQGQPAVIGWIITNVSHFIGPHVAVWNTLFALIQLAIGGGLLFRRTVRSALVISFFWVAGVWFFGEGLGMIFTGAASALTGAPGSVLMYGLLGLMAWPRRPSAAGTAPVGIASSAAGQGIGGAVTPLLAWSGYWSLAALLFVLPDNRTTTSVSSAITGMSPGEPGAYSHFLTHLGNHFGAVGVQTTWVLAVASLVIGWGPLLVRRPHLFLAGGALLSVLFWVSAQGLGGIFTGSGTDPNTGPLVIVMALAMIPATVAEASSWRSPFRALLSRLPVIAVGSVVVLGTSLFLSAAYPVSATESAGTAMSGMEGMGGVSTGGTSPCASGNGGLVRTGLNVSNSPYMIMSGSLGMDMNGSDATAAAGINSTKANWHYTGPALPNALADELLADGGNGLQDLRMAATGCAEAPTASQEINAVQYVQATSQSVSRFDNPLAAFAAGFVPASPTGYPVTYLVNPTVVAANEAARRTLNPLHVDGLVYARTPAGTEVLAAAMYILPSSVPKAPMPFGALVQWHQRTDVCAPLTGAATTPFGFSGTTPCASGTLSHPTPYITMVWQVPVAGGPLAIQPPDIQIVEAAIMQAASP
jgi:hypothetical protein